MSALAPKAKYPSFPFEKLGDEFRGIVTEPPEDSQARKYNPDPNAPVVLDTWPDGSPIIQTKVVARMADGVERAIYAKGRMAKAITAALRAAQATDIEVGSEIAVRWSDGLGKTGSPKQFQASYTPPQGGGDDDEPPF